MPPSIVLLRAPARVEHDFLATLRKSYYQTYDNGRNVMDGINAFSTEQQCRLVFHVNHDDLIRLFFTASHVSQNIRKSIIICTAAVNGGEGERKDLGENKRNEIELNLKRI